MDIGDGNDVCYAISQTNIHLRHGTDVIFALPVASSNCLCLCSIVVFGIVTVVKNATLHG